VTVPFSGLVVLVRSLPVHWKMRVRVTLPRGIETCVN
jgi:hypothetical protein